MMMEMTVTDAMIMAIMTGHLRQDQLAFRVLEIVEILTCSRLSPCICSTDPINLVVHCERQNVRLPGVEEGW